MSEYATIEHYVNHVMDEITKRGIEQVSEKLRALGWEEVVRCRDCRWYREEWIHKLMRNRIYCDWLDGVHVEPNGFCAWGERKQ